MKSTIFHPAYWGLLLASAAALAAAVPVSETIHEAAVAARDVAEPNADLAFGVRKNTRSRKENPPSSQRCVCVP